METLNSSCCSQCWNVYHEVFIRPIIISLIAKPMSQLLPCEIQLAAVWAEAVPSKRQEKHLFKGSIFSTF